MSKNEINLQLLEVVILNKLFKKECNLKLTKFHVFNLLPCSYIYN